MKRPAHNRIRLTIQAFGATVGVTLDRSDLVTDLLERLPPDWKPVDASDPIRRYELVEINEAAFSLTINDDSPSTFRNREQMLDFFEGDIQLLVAEFATPHLFVHAGVVAVNGTAILLPGRSFAGKSTLVTSLVRAGATYYSDEYAVLDADGRVLPYPRRVSLREGPHGEAQRLDLSSHAPQGDAATTPIPVGLVALLRYNAEAGWDVDELDKLPAIMAMSEQTVAIQRRPADTMAILGEVARSARVIQGTRGEADDTVQRILSIHTASRD